MHSGLERAHHCRDMKVIRVRVRVRVRVGARVKKHTGGITMCLADETDRSPYEKAVSANKTPRDKIRRPKVSRDVVLSCLHTRKKTNYVPNIAQSRRDNSVAGKYLNIFIG